MGFAIALNGEPFMTMSALQSVKEPMERLASFESCRPP
jgi:hypothetical protein